MTPVISPRMRQLPGSSFVLTMISPAAKRRCRSTGAPAQSAKPGKKIIPIYPKKIQAPRHHFIGVFIQSLMAPHRARLKG